MFIGPWGMFGLGTATGAIGMLAIIVVAAVLSNK